MSRFQKVFKYGMSNNQDITRKHSLLSDHIASDRSTDFDILLASQFKYLSYVQPLANITNMVNEQFKAI